ncbi:MAG: xanthine dehydrogenase family protein molybdopterin-binding subunit [Desulfobacterales bacterium]|nr:xanthine dehydrogenase family protein molybdopterin-binding subunit [Desulfobacterales bacterium]
MTTSIGKSIKKIDAVEKLTGKPVFCADFGFENSLVLKVLRSPYAHALINSIDTEMALKISGVKGVLTAVDIPGKNVLGIINKDQPLLAENKVRCIGEPVALIAAENEEAAEKAMAAISVSYEELPAVFSAEESLKENAPVIHEKGNLLAKKTIARGNADQEFQNCAAVIENTYTTSHIEHVYLEPDAGAGYVNDDGLLVVYASTQNPHYDLKEIISLLELDEQQVRVIQTATGGGFGSRLDLNLAGFVALALYHLKQSVRLIYSREEVFLATAKRHPLKITMKTGADKTGKLLAIKARILCDTGAYGSYGIAVAARSAVHSAGPYSVEHVDVESSCVYTNNPFSGAMRGFGAPQVAFAYESQMDLLADALKIDPLEIRQVNALQNGSVTITGQKLEESVGIGNCIEAIRSHYKDACQNQFIKNTRPYQKRGIGIGCMLYGIGNTGTKNPASARIEIDQEGTITVFTGCADIGQGSTTIFTQIAAEVLGVTTDHIKICTADTKFTPNAGATSASRQTYISGNAIKQAADKMADTLLDQAASHLNADKANLILTNEYAVITNNPDKKVSFSDLAVSLHKKEDDTCWHGFFDPQTTPLDENGQGAPYATYAFACQLAIVSVDTLTGEVNVEKIVAAHDVGKAIHPEQVKGQICGGIAMGLGFALMEEFEPGKTISMKDYHIPTSIDIPDIEPIIIESNEPSGPFGAKGVGEPALIPTSPAILNALNNALGERIYSLPANLERVLEACIKSGNFEPKENDNE